MKNYSIDYKPYEKYNAIVYSASYINPFADIKDITTDIRKHFVNAGYILIDLLLCNGNEFNRFAEAYFDGTEISKKSIRIVSITNEEQLKKMNQHYRGRYKELNNSVLSPSERLKYAK